MIITYPKLEKNWNGPQNFEAHQTLNYVTNQLDLVGEL